MSSFEPKNDRPCELPLLVFTNSRDDYAVTVRVPADASPDRMQRTAQWIDALARRCDAWLARGGATLVGVVPSPDRADHALAVRVFDVGEFRGRPHTLAIVAVELPPDWLAGHSAARLLAALSPPVPDADHYQIPTDQEIQISRISAEPFASLDAWERTVPHHQPKEPTLFSQPAEIANDLGRLDPQLRGGKSSRRRQLIVAIMCMAIVSVALSAVFAWNSVNRSAAMKAARSKYPAPTLAEVGITREMLLSRLANSGVRLTPGITDEQAAQIVVATSRIIHERMDTLAEELESHENEPPRASLAILLRHRQLWMAPIKAESGSSARLDTEVLCFAMFVHRLYGKRLADLMSLDQIDPDSSEFARKLKDLRYGFWLEPLNR